MKFGGRWRTLLINLFYPEYLRGPCDEKEKLVNGEAGPKCVKDECPEGQLKWEDGSCVSVLVPNSEQLTNAERELFPIDVTPFSTIENCHIENKKGECLKETEAPDSSGTEASCSDFPKVCEN